MTVVVTGASGHIGANLVRELLRRGRTVRVMVHRDTRALEGLDLERVTADLLDFDTLLQAFRGADLVFHLAARISITGDDGGLVPRTNVEGTRNVVSACRQCGVRRIWSRTSRGRFTSRATDRAVAVHSPFRGLFSACNRNNRCPW